MKTSVIFYIEKDRETQNENVLAVFPYNHERVGFVSCYAHVGQHSVASVEYCNELKKASKKQYLSLAKELTSLEYELKILN